MPGVERLTLKNDAGHEYLNKLGLKSIFERSQHQADQYRQGFLSLKSQNWEPDIVISHSGWGCGLHVKEIWPKSKLISYLEWWFNPESDFFYYDKENERLGLNPKGIKKCWLRNQYVALELSSADQIVAPTEWQRKQLPASLRKRCHVIFDGVDLNCYKPLENKEHRREDIITYGTRGMDPMRCFPQFIEELPELLATFPNCKVEIAGQDKAFYGVNKIKEFGSWGSWAKSFIKRKGISDKIKWLGNLPPGKYEHWLRTSGCHVYLTHPFVCSWSLVEAYCSGAPIIASKIETVRDICENNPGVYYADHRKKGFLVEALSKMRHDRQGGQMEIWPYPRDRAKFGVKQALRGWEHVAGLKVTTKD